MTTIAVLLNSAAAQVYAITDLGTLGGTATEATAINKSGVVVGWSYLVGDHTYRAFKWTAAGGMVDIGTLGGGNSMAHGINGAGTICGEAQNALFQTRAFYKTPAGPLVDIGTLPRGKESRATGIDNSGRIVGFGPTNGGTVVHAFRWTSATGMVDIDSRPGQNSYAYAINTAGHVVGSVETTPGQFVPFFWTLVGGVIALTTDTGTAFAINSGDDCAGTATEHFDSTTTVMAKVWSDSSGPGFGTSYGPSSVYGLNVDGIAVGEGAGVDGPYAFTWQYPDPHFALYEKLAPADKAAWYSLIRATAINDSGQIVGYGIKTAGGPHRALLLTPVVIKSLTLTPSTVHGGNTFTAKVTLNAPAPRNLTFHLSSSDTTVVGTPGSVTVLSGFTSASKSVSTNGVSASKMVVISASGEGLVPRAATVTVTP